MQTCGAKDTTVRKSKAPDPEIQEIFESEAQKGSIGKRKRKKAHTSEEMAKSPLKRPSLTQALIDEVGKDETALPRIAKRALDDAAAGDGKARDWISERLDGKVVTPVVIDGIENLTDEQLAAVRESLARSKG